MVRINKMIYVYVSSVEPSSVIINRSHIVDNRVAKQRNAAIE